MLKYHVECFFTFKYFFLIFLCFNVKRRIVNFA